MIGEDACPGVKQNGFPYLIRRSVECSCPGDAIPATIEVDISGLNLGQTVLLSQLKLPQNIKLVAKVLSTAKACLVVALFLCHQHSMLAVYNSSVMCSPDSRAMSCSIRNYQCARLLAKGQEKAK